MKKLFKICAAILAAITVLSFAGCSARTPVTSDEFSKQAKSEGFTVKEETTSNADVVKYVTAIKSETGTEIMYISFKTEAAAEKLYNSVKTGVTEGTNGTSKTLDSATYCKYSLVNGELDHTLARMGSTVVYGKTTTTHQNQVDDLFKAIKY